MPSNTTLTGITLRQYKDLLYESLFELKHYTVAALRVITLRAEAIQQLLYASFTTSGKLGALHLADGEKCEALSSRSSMENHRTIMKKSIVPKIIRDQPRGFGITPEYP